MVSTEVRGPKEKSGDPSPLQVKNVQIERRRYVVCVNTDQAKKDKADREAIVGARRGTTQARRQVAGGQPWLSQIPSRRRDAL